MSKPPAPPPATSQDQGDGSVDRLSPVISSTELKSSLKSRLESRLSQRSSSSSSSKVRSADAPGSRMERISSFLQTFSRGLTSLRVGLLAFEKKTPPDGQSVLKTLSQSKQELVQLLNLNVRILPDYDKQRCNESVRGVEERLRKLLAAEAKGSGSGFSFSSRSKERRRRRRRKKPAAEVTPTPKSTSSKPKGDDVDISKFDRSVSGYNKEDRTFTPSSTIRRSSASGAPEEEGEGKLMSVEDSYFLLSDCSESTLRFPFCIGTGYVRNLRSCVVLMGPIKASVFIDDCRDCTFHVAGRQIRIRSCVDCTFYLCVRSKPIIEKSRGVGVAPYAYDYEGSQEDLVRCSLKGLGGEIPNNWDQIEDFDWQLLEHSPNWSVIPEDQRKTAEVKKAQ